MVRLELTDFGCSGFFDTLHNQIEFFVHLTPYSDRKLAVESWERMLQSAHV
jgi:hypothetical protein